MDLQNEKCVMVIDEHLPMGLIANTAAIMGITLGKKMPEVCLCCDNIKYNDRERNEWYNKRNQEDKFRSCGGISKMKLADLSTGPDWIVWIVFLILAVLSIVLIYGHASWFISGYNMASKEEKAKYNEKKLCRTMGIGMSVIAILLLIMGLFENALPAFFVYISLGIILVDVVVIIILGNTICRK